LIEIACLDLTFFFCQMLVLQAFLLTWDLACAVENGAMNVLSGYDFLVYPTIFNGSNCSSNLQLQVGVDLFSSQKSLNCLSSNSIIFLPRFAFLNYNV
jgi:hypothetical protein